MKKRRKIRSWFQFTIFISITLVLILFISKLPSRQDYESILSDASIFKNGSPRLPTLRSINNTCFVYKKLSRYYYNLKEDCFAPNTSELKVNVKFDKIETIDGYWYGENCFLMFINTDKVINGQPEKSTKNWGESIHGKGVTKVSPTFSCIFSPNSFDKKNKVYAEMSITYPMGSSNFTNRVQKLQKGFNIEFIPTEKYIALTNYERSKNSTLYIILSIVFYIILMWIFISKSYS